MREELEKPERGARRLRAESIDELRPTGDRRLVTPSGLDVRTLIALSLGEYFELDAHEEPPAAVLRWLDQANLSQLRGMVLGVLQRWQQLS